VVQALGGDLFRQRLDQVEMAGGDDGADRLDDILIGQDGMAVSVASGARGPTIRSTDTRMRCGRTFSNS